MPMDLNIPFILSYALQDNPGYELDVFVKDLGAARAHLQGKSDMVVWASLSDTRGNVVADSGDLL